MTVLYPILEYSCTQKRTFVVARTHSLLNALWKIFGRAQKIRMKVLRKLIPEMYEYAANQLVVVIHHLFYVQSSIHLEYKNAVMSEFV